MKPNSSTRSAGEPNSGGRWTGAERKTVRRWLRAGAAPSWRQPQHVGMLGSYCGYLDRRWHEGCHNAARLWRELVSIGFTGRPGTVRHWAGQRRKDTPSLTSAGSPPIATLHAPTARQMTRLLLRDDAPPDTPQSLVSRALAELPALAACIAAARRLSGVLWCKSKESLDEVLKAAAGTALEEFAMNLRRDLGAVQAARDLPWTTSPAEGQISRLKMLKRSMHGRAGFKLLRARVLHAA